MRHFKEKHAEEVRLYTCPHCCSFTNVRKNRTTTHMLNCQHNTDNSLTFFVHKISRELFTVLGSDELKDELTSADKKAALTLTFFKKSN